MAILRRLAAPFYRSPRRRPTLEEVLEGYALTAQAEGKSPKTVEWVAQTTNRFARFLTGQGLATEVDAVGPEEVRAFIRHLQTSLRYADHPATYTQATLLSGHTVNAYVRALSLLFSWLEKESPLATNPFQQVRIPPAPKTLPTVLSLAELGRIEGAIIAHSRNPHRDLLLFYVLFDTMARLSEATGLLMEDVDIAGRRVVVWGKGRKRRELPLGIRTQALLWQYITLERPDLADPFADFLFLSADGRPLARRRVQKLCKQWGVWAGLAPKRLHAHALRRSGATEFIRSGGEWSALQRLLGHEDLATTQRYVVLGADHVNEEHRVHSPGDALARSQNAGNGHSWQRRYEDKRRPRERTGIRPTGGSDEHFGDIWEEAGKRSRV